MIRQVGTRLVVLGASLALFAGCGDARGGDRLPDVAVEPLAGGQPVALSDIDGPAVVNLWATWCVPCLTEIPDFETVHESRGDDVRFVGINIGEDAAQAAAFIEDVGATYDQYLDHDGSVAVGLEASTMPFTVVIDSDGDIVDRHLGAMSQGELNDAIDRAVDS